MTSEIKYLGELRTSATHIKSNQTIITDAPTDNQGKGEAFSPTDLVATALGSCMLTIMGIKARDMEIDLGETTISVVKVMGTEPRRITDVQIEINVPNSVNWEEKTKTILKNAALTCPVAKSLDPALKQDVTINFN